MSVTAHSGQFMEKYERMTIHGRWLEIDAWCGEKGPENRVDIKGSNGEYVSITGHTVHHIVKEVMRAAPNWMKKDMINHLEALLEGKETY
jgi:hypothetical protein